MLCIFTLNILVCYGLHTYLLKWLLRIPPSLTQSNLLSYFPLVEYYVTSHFPLAHCCSEGQMDHPRNYHCGGDVPARCFDKRLVLFLVQPSEVSVMSILQMRNRMPGYISLFLRGRQFQALDLEKNSVQT